MSIRSSWLRQFASSCFGPAARHRRSSHRLPPVEALEDRKCLSANVMLLDQGHTLRIVGDAGDNQIVIQRNEKGVQITADAAAPQRFTGIDSIEIETGGGNDSVMVIYGFNPQPDPPDAPLSSFDLKVQLGAGNDQFLANIQFPPDPCLVMVDAGTGHDVVTLQGSVDNGSGGLNFSAELGEGNDRFTGNLQWPSGVPTPEEAAYPPDPCYLAVTAGGGADTINTLIGLLSNALPAQDVPVPLSLSLDGGDGNDVVKSSLSNLILHGPTTIDLQGGTGNDAVTQVLNAVAANAGLNLTADGGRGDDTVGITAGAATPSLFVNSSVRLTLEGGLGNDRLHGLLVPCIMPEASLDVIFSGGSGNDLFDILLALEADSPDSTGPSEGPVGLTLLGGDGNDQLRLSIQNLGQSKSMLDLQHAGGSGDDTAVVTPSIDTSGWTK